ncbi:MAG: hypothetical protein KBT48_00730 [Firmicutes bacterium]|nr:hypothetical protein [Bacillota bacterium]
MNKNFEPTAWLDMNETNSTIMELRTIQSTHDQANRMLNKLVGDYKKHDPDHSFIGKVKEMRCDKFYTLYVFKTC